MRFTTKMKFPPEILTQISSDKRMLQKVNEGDAPKSWLNVELIFFPGAEDPLSVDIQLKWSIESLTED